MLSIITAFLDILSFLGFKVIEDVMFNRVALKLKAKNHIKGTWFPCAAIISIVTFAVITLLMFIIEKGVLPFAFSFILLIVVSGGFLIANSCFYLKYEKLILQQKPDFCTFFDGFSYLKTGVLSFLWMLLWICLWSVCFIIPGIIKLFSYSMTFLVLAEKPNMSVKKAMRISIKITSGYKSEIFMTFLSFAGWLILSFCTCGVLFIWVGPYMKLTHVNIYHYLKEEALRIGTVTQADFDECK
ncbi:MAG: DUF975 family protein [Treponemataceae bacterium]|nr:DUF975 family protein [Treponemataceae bacterium]